ncbi:MAG: stage III sporulation protein AA [Lachnospiraceae bacterium]|nr:stage III sporulation protein AA [Lachnospiraceae bacterium]
MNSNEIQSLFPGKLKELFAEIFCVLDSVEEIRLGVNRPVLIGKTDGEFYLTGTGILKGCNANFKDAYFFSCREISDVFMRVCNDSVYAYEDELSQGFVTIHGGHRVGICGHVVVKNHEITGVKYIASLNIRIAHEMPGISDRIYPFLFEKKEYQNTLIISPPGCGKTTLLRDLIRNLSTGNKSQQGTRVGVVDERSEISAAFHGVPQMQLGPRTDVLSCCPKEIGIKMLLRTMSPRIIAVDELGTKGETEELVRASYSGCRILATMHGSSLEELQHKENLNIQRFIFLSNRNGAGTIEKIIDGKGTKLEMDWDVYAHHRNIGDGNCDETGTLFKTW